MHLGYADDHVNNTRVVLQALVLVAVAVAATSAFPHPEKVGSYNQPKGYFMYLNVPRHKEYEAGFNRGNEKHHISRFDQVKDHRFRTRVKWSDAHDGHGEHYFEYNHGPKYPDYDHKSSSPHAAYEPVVHEPVYHKPDPYAHH
ncbi:hypothetical protein HAZT_HAZT001693 [Hyalella azteca]|uniref:Uncharacterized protein n=1 Tax=Hyalella azteca TaxID=294128 RepID=A0A6A0H570_HYAAZ|nr:hypothetical protein HAZT_HAZT001693 [Hyalella azteca]